MESFTENIYILIEQKVGIEDVSDIPWTLRSWMGALTMPTL